jgi:iron complex transport system substrate-binding protein
MKKYIVLIMIFVIAAGLFTGCGNSNTDGPSATTASVSTDKGKRTITDSLGRKVVIPSTIERIVSLGNTPRMITYLGLANKVVGIGGMDADKITPVTALLCK